MNVVGIITEYNPFHNGHLHHINMAKKLTNSDFVVVIMSGNFLQRGVPAIIDKYSRTKMALSCGADLVVELPCAFASSSAETFAYGAVSILDLMGCVNALCFGSEYGEIHILKEIAKVLVNEPEEFKQYLKNYLKDGYSFPIARTKALLDYPFDYAISKLELEQLLSEPNNILAIEYLKALLKRKSKMEPVTIKRIVAGYHDTSLHETICSASAIRNALLAGGLESFQNQVPESVYEILAKEYNQTFPIYYNDFSTVMKYRLLLNKELPHTSYLDVSKELAHTITNHLAEFKKIDDFAALIKSKQYTLTRIYRSLLHILLNIEEIPKDDESLYIRILGFQKGSAPLLTLIKEHSAIPMISKLADAKHLLEHSALKLLSQDMFATNLYDSIVCEKFDCSPHNEFQQPIIIL